MSIMSKLLCTNVSKQAWNDEKVTLESDDTKVIIHIKDQSEHGQFEVGSEYDLSVGEKVKAKASAKKSSKKTAKKVAKKVAKKGVAPKTTPTGAEIKG